MEVNAITHLINKVECGAIFDALHPLRGGRRKNLCFGARSQSKLVGVIEYIPLTGNTWLLERFYHSIETKKNILIQESLKMFTKMVEVEELIITNRDIGEEDLIGLDFEECQETLEESMFERDGETVHEYSLQRIASKLRAKVENLIAFGKLKSKIQTRKVFRKSLTKNNVSHYLHRICPIAQACLSLKEFEEKMLLLGTDENKMPGPLCNPRHGLMAEKEFQKQGGTWESIFNHCCGL